MPRIIQTRDRALWVQYRDYTISVETLLPGQKSTSTRPEILRAAGSSLAQIHKAATSFASFPQQMQSVRGYVEELFGQSLAYSLSANEAEAVALLYRRVKEEYEAILDLPVPWLLCHEDVRASNVLVTEEDKVWFTDFSGADYAPALLDLVMPRFQWLMGEGQESRFLSISESVSILLGYQRERPLEVYERAVFPVVWAAFYTERLTFLHTKWGPQSPNRLLWPIRERIIGLPTQALEVGRELMQVSGLL